MTDEEFVLSNTEFATFESSHVRMKYRDMNFIYEIFPDYPIQYGRTGDFDLLNLKVMIPRIESTEEEKQEAWHEAANHVREYHYILEHTEEFTIYPETECSHMMACPKTNRVA